MGIELIKPSQHGLGHLLNPINPDSEDRSWITHTWEWIHASATGRLCAEPPWLDRPAIGRLTATSPHLHRLLAPLNKGHGYAEQIKPFNFLLIAFVHPLERPAHEERIALIAPFSNDPRKWLNLPWICRYSGLQYRITTEPSHGRELDGLIAVKTYRDILTDFATHPEHKSADLEGPTCSRQTAGILQRRPLAARTVTHIGKESNSLEDAQGGLVQVQEETLSSYDDTDRLVFEREMLPVLRGLGVREVARRTGLSLGAVQGVLAGTALPRQASLKRYLKALDASKGLTQPPHQGVALTLVDQD